MYSIVIPAYNEERRVGPTIHSYISFLNKNKINYEIIVICDGCTDRTVDVVKKFSHNEKIRLFVLPQRLGKGGGVHYGFSKCSGDTIGFVDADNAVRPEEFKKLIDNIEGVDCVIASRRVENAIMLIPPKSRLWVFSMRLLSQIFNKVVVNLIFRLNIKDTQCGAKFMKRYVYENIRNELKINGFEFDVELLWRIKEHGYKIKEVGVIWRHDLESKSRIMNSFNMLISLLKRKYWSSL